MTVALFNNFGTGASNSLAGNEQLASLTITTGTAPGTGVIRLAYSGSVLKIAPAVTILPLDSPTAALDLSSSGPTGFTEYTFSVAGLAANTTYRWALRID